MGYAGMTSYSSGNNWPSVQEAYPIVLDDLSCGDPETGIESCTFTTEDNCGHGEDISLKCNNGPGNWYYNITSENVLE